MRGRIPALDGLRGVAVLLVVTYHAWPNLNRGGAYGVTLFFVLSGFLITRILIRRDQVDFRRFYLRRAARLLPALIVFLASWWLLTGTWSWHPLTYTANYAWIAGDGVFGLAHMWSLSVEEHFYVLWPLMVAFTPRRWMAATTASLLAVGVAWRLLMLDAPFERVMWGTDTAAFAILAGCLLAVVQWRPPAHWGTPATVGLVAFSLVTPAWTTGYLVVELLVVVLAVVAVGVAASAPVRWLEAKPLVWCGVVAYGLYLWHGALLHLWPIPVALVAAFGLSAASWYVVEQPILEWSGPRIERRPDRTVVVAEDPPDLVRAT